MIQESNDSVKSRSVTTMGERLVEFASLMNLHGIDSAEANAFLARNCCDAEFVELAELSRRIKRELMVQHSAEQGAMRIAK